MASFEYSLLALHNYLPLSKFAIYFMSNVIVLRQPSYESEAFSIEQHFWISLHLDLKLFELIKHNFDSAIKNMD